MYVRSWKTVSGRGPYLEFANGDFDLNLQMVAVRKQVAIKASFWSTTEQNMYVLGKLC